MVPRLSCVARAAHMHGEGREAVAGGEAGPASPPPAHPPTPGSSPSLSSSEEGGSSPSSSGRGRTGLNAGAQGRAGKHQRQCHEPGAGPALPARPLPGHPHTWPRRERPVGRGPAASSVCPGRQIPFPRTLTVLPQPGSRGSWEGGKGKWPRWGVCCLITGRTGPLSSPMPQPWDRPLWREGWWADERRTVGG